MTRRRAVRRKASGAKAIPRTVPKLGAWSFSAYKDYRYECPRKLRLTKIDRLPIPEQDRGKALIRGEEVHIQAHRYVVEGGRLPPDLQSFREEFKALRVAVRDRHREVLTEQQWGFDRNWKEAPWFDGGTGQTYVRVVSDAVILEQRAETVSIIDYKTGKERSWHQEQLELYGRAVFAKYAWAQKINAGLWYLDQDSALDLEFTRDEDADELERLWVKRTKKMLNDTRFDPRPGAHCRWCPFSKDKGGPCQY